MIWEIVGNVSEVSVEMVISVCEDMNMDREIPSKHIEID